MGHYDECYESYEREREERSRLSKKKHDDFVAKSLHDAKMLVENSRENVHKRTLEKVGIEKTTVVVYKTADGAMFFNEEDARKHVQSFDHGSGI